MSFWQQGRDALRGHIEDWMRSYRGFFAVPLRAVILLLVVIAALFGEAYLRTVHGTSAFFGWRMAMLFVVLLLLRGVRRLIP